MKGAPPEMLRARILYELAKADLIPAIGEDHAPLEAIQEQHEDCVARGHGHRLRGAYGCLNEGARRAIIAKGTPFFEQGSVGGVSKPGHPPASGTRGPQAEIESTTGAEPWASATSVKSTPVGPNFWQGTGPPRDAGETVGAGQ